MTTRQWLREIERAVKRLEQSAGRPIARRNARANLARTLRGIRSTARREFPHIRTEHSVKPRRAPRTPAQRVSETIKAGWVRIVRVDTIAKAAAAGIRCRNLAGVVYLPAWVALLSNLSASDLSKARRSPKIRRALIAARTMMTEAV